MYIYSPKSACGPLNLIRTSSVYIYIWTEFCTWILCLGRRSMLTIICYISVIFHQKATSIPIKKTYIFCIYAYRSRVWKCIYKFIQIVISLNFLFQTKKINTKDTQSNEWNRLYHKYYFKNQKCKNITQIKNSWLLINTIYHPQHFCLSKTVQIIDPIVLNMLTTTSFAGFGPPTYI